GGDPMSEDLTIETIAATDPDHDRQPLRSAGRAARAVLAYATDPAVRDDESAIDDLLTDLLHLSDALDLPGNTVEDRLRRAAVNHAEEVFGDGAEHPGESDAL